MFKVLKIFTIIALAVACSTGQKDKVSQTNFLTFDLRSYDVAESNSGWMACESEYLKMKKVKSVTKLLNEPLAELDQDHCAAYRCEKNNCMAKGSYLAFSEVVNFLLKKNKRLEYTSKKSNNFYDIERESENCFKSDVVNSCAILSAYYKYRSYNRNKFYQVRTRECELLGITQKNCSFDL